ncbi:uncharacterized protein LOC117527214 isoform X3 [Thalassophryne amazonica]|uniref:uncharacterized protein LOC117527214 isoform X3 n=1 Tax=Thalassophryne amazonica TaxID=390379 RepID=UPI0014726304|nr:uncharacterized protein LOC117527214 isoform X3 [Thalassophryne amazonica]
MQQLLVSKEDILPEQQEWNQSLDQKNSEPTNIKEEQEELWTEDEEKPQSSQLHQSQRDESAEVELLSRNSNRHRTLKTEAHEDDCGGSQPASSSNLQPHGDGSGYMSLQADHTALCLLFCTAPRWTGRRLTVDQ